MLGQTDKLKRKIKPQVGKVTTAARMPLGVMTYGDLEKHHSHKSVCQLSIVSPEKTG